ncbi:hypothetical protein BGM24_15485 [Bacillus sp. FJAT-26377]|nr:hypothetical protein [Bacillus sp. FJAT-26377]
MPSREQKLKKLSIEELRAKLSEELKKNPPRKIESDKDGTIILDPNNPQDCEWYDNDDAYGGYKTDD